MRGLRPERARRPPKDPAAARRQRPGQNLPAALRGKRGPGKGRGYFVCDRLRPADGPEAKLFFQWRGGRPGIFRLPPASDRRSGHGAADRNRYRGAVLQPAQRPDFPGPVYRREHQPVPGGIAQPLHRTLHLPPAGHPLRRGPPFPGEGYSAGEVVVSD